MQQRPARERMIGAACYNPDPDGTHQSEALNKMHTLEIRSYTLKPGTRGQFDRLFLTEALPMLRRWQVDVVAYGPSPHDEESYYLMRAYASLAERARSQDAFYGSDEWRQGPREAIIACIEHMTSIVIDADDQVLQGLRQG